MIDAHPSHQGSMGSYREPRSPEAPQSWECSPASPLAQTLGQWDYGGIQEARRASVLGREHPHHLLLVPVDAPELISPGRRWAWKGASQCSWNEGIVCGDDTNCPPSVAKQTRTPQGSPLLCPSGNRFYQVDAAAPPCGILIKKQEARSSGIFPWTRF